MFFHTLLTGIFIILAAIILWPRKCRKKNLLPPGPINWPLLGSAVTLLNINSKYLHLALKDLSTKFGDVMGLHLSGNYTVVISSYEVMKSVLTNSSTTGERFPFCEMNPHSKNRKSLGIIWGYGQSWEELKRHFKQSLRKVCRSQSMNKIINAEAHSFVENAVKSTNTIFIISINTFLGNIVNILWGSISGKISENGNHSLEIEKELLNTAEFWGGYMFPRWVLNIFDHRRIKERTKSITKMRFFIRKQIDAAREKVPVAFPDSLIECFLQKAKDEHFTVDQLEATLLDINSSGTEPVNAALAWMMLHLSLNPKVQEKVYDEILKDNEETFSKTLLRNNSNMTYRMATIYEVFRLSNVLPLPVPRVATIDFYIKEYLIPKGTCLMFNLEPVFKDSSYWGDAESFRPERFLNAKEDKLIKTERMGMFGFGSKRFCLGEKLVWNILINFLTVICKSVKLSPAFDIKQSQMPRPGYLTLLPEDFSLHIRQRGSL